MLSARRGRMSNGTTVSIQSMSSGTRGLDPTGQLPVLGFCLAPPCLHLRVFVKALDDEDDLAGHELSSSSHFFYIDDLMQG